MVRTFETRRYSPGNVCRQYHLDASSEHGGEGGRQEEEVVSESRKEW